MSEVNFQGNGDRNMLNPEHYYKASLSSVKYHYDLKNGCTVIGLVQPNMFEPPEPESDSSEDTDLPENQPRSSHNNLQLSGRTINANAL